MLLEKGFKIPWMNFCYYYLLKCNSQIYNFSLSSGLLLGLWANTMNSQLLAASFFPFFHIFFIWIGQKLRQEEATHRESERDTYRPASALVKHTCLGGLWGSLEPRPLCSFCAGWHECLAGTPPPDCHWNIFLYCPYFFCEKLQIRQEVSRKLPFSYNK